jgi:orotidine-5'-phosphate decarboxylase
VQVLYNEDDFSWRAPRWGDFPPEVGIKFGVEQMFGPDPLHEENSVLRKKIALAKSQGRAVIIDPKLFATPYSMSKAAADIAQLCVTGFTIAAHSGVDSCHAATQAARVSYDRFEYPRPPRPLVLGVTELSSKTDEDCIAESGDKADTWHKACARLAWRLKQSGADGVVCTSVGLLKHVKCVWPEAVTMVTSIRSAEITITGDDQRHWMTLDEALTNGADIICLGRIVSQSPDPAAAMRDILAKVAAHT